MMDEEKLKMGFSPRAQCVVCGADTGMVEDGKPHICANCHSNPGELKEVGMVIV